MSNPYSNVKAFGKTGALNVIVETPKGVRTKFKLDTTTGLFKISHVLAIGSAFPFDFGFVPATKGEDGDPLDVLVLVDEPTFTGCLLESRLIGVIEAEQTEGEKTFRNDRFVAVPMESREHITLTDISEMDEKELRTIKDFFIDYNKLRGREFKPIGVRGADYAIEAMKKASKR